MDSTAQDEKRSRQPDGSTPQARLGPGEPALPSSKSPVDMALASDGFATGPAQRRRSLFNLLTVLALLILSALALAETATEKQRDTVGSRSFEEEAGRQKYLIGVGKGDITGPVVEINFAGYANTDQKGTGLRQRLYSRAFIIADVEKPDDRFVYLVLDTQSGDTAMRNGVLDALKGLGEDYAVYGQNNIALTGTHSHSGPGAWFNYLLPQITSFGFDQQSYQAIVDGCLAAIKAAHQNLQEGYLSVGQTDIADGAINRSRWAYLQNPQEERSRYGAETDITMTLLRFQRASDGKSIGVLSWFPVHGTSMLGNNTHASGDNKGVAAWLFETAMANDKSAAPGFVAGFSQANVGDTTPNVLGAYCDDGSGQQCSLENSTCADGKSQSCHGRGPVFQALDLGVKSCYEMGRRQFAGALSIYKSIDSAGTPVVGSTVKAFHFFHDMRYFNFTMPNGKTGQTCPAALGHSFAAGTSDWPGAFDFTQGESGNPTNPVWNVVAGLLKAPGPRQVQCQAPKPVLLDVGEMSSPYAWTPNIVDIQMLRVGQLVIIVSPSEATTMAGRRWKAAVSQEAATFLDQQKPVVVLGGPANSYSHYCATPEEYDVQRYEGASTLFGRNELYAYINLTVGNMHYLRPDATDKPSQGGPPPDNRGNMISFITGVVQDNAPGGSAFGSVLAQPRAAYSLGATVNVTFQGANPRNNLRLGATFVAIEQQQQQQQTAGGGWVRVRDDADWFLVYTWRRTNWLLGYSEVDVTWETGGNAKPGTYRVKYYGDAKPLIGKVAAFEGTSNAFVLT